MSTIIKTNRLILRDWNRNDIKPYYMINQDPKVIEYLPSSMTLEQVEDFVEKMNKQLQKKNYTLFAVELKKTGEFMGFTGLNHTDFSSFFTPAVEIAWRLGSQFWGMGYATEASEAVLRFGFKTIKLEEILSFTTPKNLRSIRVMEKIGLTRDLNGDFLHPKLNKDHNLAHHVLYKISVHAYQERMKSSVLGKD